MTERNLSFTQIQELETENSELKQQLQDLEEQLMIAHVPPVRTNHTHARTHTQWGELSLFNLKVISVFIRTPGFANVASVLMHNLDRSAGSHHLITG